MAGNKIGLVLALDGEKEFTNSLRQIGAETKKVQTEIKSLASEYEGNANSLEHLSKKQELLSKAQSASARAVEQAKSAASKANSIYSEQGKHLQKLENALEKAKKRQEEAAKSVGKGSDEYKKYSKRVQELEKAVEKQSTSHSKAAQQVTKWETEVVKAESALRKDNKALQDNEKYMKEASQSADKCAKSIDKMGKESKDASGEVKDLGERVKDALTVAAGNIAADAMRELGQAAVEAGKYVVDVGSSFEKAMSEVEAISGANSSQLAQMEEAAKSLSSTTKFSASAVAEGFKYMSLAGWDTEAMLNAIDGVVNLAAASEMELGEASDMVTDYLSAFGMEASEATKMADMLAFAQANSNTTVRQLGDAYGNAAANLHSAGQDIETVTAFLEAMANQGTKGAEAGTALSAVMRDISQKAAKTGDGTIAIGNMSIAVQDAEGNFRDLNDIMADVEKATAGMGTAERDMALRSTFTSKSIKAVNEVLTEGVNNVNEYEKALRKSDGSAKQMADTMMDNLKGSIDEFNSAREGLGIALYDKVSGPLTSIVDVGTSVLSGLTGIIQGTTTESEKMVEQLNDASDALKNSKSAYENIGESTEAEAAKIDILVRELEALNSQDELTETQKARVKAIIEELAGVMPELTDAYDAQTGKISLENTELEKLAKTAKEVMISDAIQEAEKAYVSAYVNAELAYKQGEKELNLLKDKQTFYQNLQETINSANEMADDWDPEAYKASQIDMWNAALEAGTITAEEYAEGMEHISQGGGNLIDVNQWLADKLWNTTAAVNDQDVAVKELGADLNEADDNLKDFHATSEEYLETQEKENGIIDDGAASAETLANEQRQLVHAKKESAEASEELADAEESATNFHNKVQMEAKKAAEAHRELAVRQRESAEIAEASAKKVSDAWDKSVEETKKSLGSIDPTKAFDDGGFTNTWDMIDNLQSQIDGMNEYSENLDKLNEHIGKEVSPEFAKYIQDMGLSGAGFLDNILLALESEDGAERVRQICEEYAEATNIQDELSVQMAGNRAALEREIQGMGSTDVEFDALSNAITNGLKGIDEQTRAEVESLVATAKEIGVTIPEGLTESIKNGDINVDNIESQLTGAMNGAIEGVAEAVQKAGGTIPDDLKEGIENGSIGFEEAYERLFDCFADVEPNTPVEETANDKIINPLKSSIEAGQVEIKAQAKGLADAVVEGIGSSTDQVEAKGKAVAVNFATGIASAKSVAEQEAASMVSEALAAASSQVNQASEIGAYIAAGVAHGIEIGSSPVAAAARRMVSEALAAAKAEADIHSPSKKFEKFVGKWIPAGVEKGITKNTYKTAQAAANMVGQALATAVTTMQKKGKGSAANIANTWSTLLDTELNRVKKNKKGKTLAEEFGISWFTTEGSGKKKHKVKKDAETYYGEVLSAANQYFSNINTLHKMSDKQELDYWTKVRKHLKKGTQAWYDATDKINEAKERIAEAVAEVDNKILSDAETQFEHESILHDKSLQEQLDYWNNVIKGLKAYSDAWYEVMAKIKGIKEDIAKEQEEAIVTEDEYFSEAEHYFSNLSSVYDYTAEEEKAYWESVFVNLEEGSDAWYKCLSNIKKCNEEIAKSEEEVAEAVKEAEEKQQEELEKTAEEAKKKADAIKAASKAAADGIAQIGNFDVASSMLSSYTDMEETSEMSIMQYWDRIRKQYKVGTEDRIKAEREYAKAAKKYNDSLISAEEKYADAVQKAIDKKKKSIESLTKSIVNAFDIFSEFESESATGEDLLYNIQTQAAGYEFWQETLDSLSKRGILSQNLIQELTDKGPQDAAAIHALNSLTDEQLKAYQAAYEKKTAIAQKQAEESAEIQQEFYNDMLEAQAERQETLAKLNEGMSSGLSNVADAVKDTTKEQVDRVVDGILGLGGTIGEERKTYEQNVREIIKGAFESLDEYGLATDEAVDAATKAVTDGGFQTDKNADAIGTAIEGTINNLPDKLPEPTNNTTNNYNNTDNSNVDNSTTDNNTTNNYYGDKPALTAPTATPGTVKPTTTPTPTPSTVPKPSMSAVYTTDAAKHQAWLGSIQSLLQSGKGLGTKPKLTKAERAKHVPLWLHLFDKYGIWADNAFYQSLGKLLGVSLSKSPTKAQKNQMLDILKANGFRSGTKHLDDIFAWLDEEGLGSEMIVRKSDGARLSTNVRKGDMIVPAANTDNLWDWSQIVPTDMLNAIAAQNAVTQAYVTDMMQRINVGALNDSLSGGSAGKSNEMLSQMVGLMTEFLPYLAEKTSINVDGRKLVSATGGYTSEMLAARSRRYSR